MVEMGRMWEEIRNGELFGGDVKGVVGLGSIGGCLGWRFKFGRYCLNMVFK